MAEFKVRTRGDSAPKGKPRVYFTCHQEDFDKYFDRICEDIFKTHDCAIYYTEDMTAALDETNISVDLHVMNLFLVPVTLKLLAEDNRAMQVDIAYAKERHIPILPFMMEEGIDPIYSQTRNFGERQYLNPGSTDTTEVGYLEKLKKHLDSVLISDEMAKRVRAAFDAYVFLSYRKKDRAYANELMRIIHSIPECRDIAIWYDEFLTPGESFAENIKKAMEKSELFTLLVTPNLLEEGNFVMREEYPRAKGAGMDILPTEMIETDLDSLTARFEGIPTPVRTDDEKFSQTLLSVIERVAKAENDGDAEHNFLIGLAYLDGIDVEVDTERGLELITSAAESGLPEAMEKLYYLYDAGHMVNLDYSVAQKWAEKITDYYVNSFGEDNEYSMMWIHNLAHTCVDVAEYDKAIMLQEWALSLARKKLGDKSYETISCINALATSYYMLGEYKKSIKLQKEALKLGEKALGEDHIETLSAVIGLGQILFDTGDTNGGIKLMEQAAERSRRYFGDSHELTLIALNNLSLAYCEIGKFAKALDISVAAYDKLVEIKGENHPSTITALNNTALIEQKIGNIPKALETIKRVVDVRSEIFGNNHPDTLRAISNMGVLYFYAGDFKRGRDLINSIKEQYISTFGSEHHDSITLINNLAIAYLNLGDTSRALTLFKNGYDTMRRVLGENHPDTLLAANNTANAYIRIGEIAKAKEILDKEYPKTLELLGIEHPTTLMMITQVTNVRLRSGDIQGGLEIAESSYPYFCKIFGEDNAETLICATNIAYVYSLTGRFAEAKEQQTRILSLYKRMFGDYHHETLTAANNLGYTLLSMREFDEALKLYERACECSIAALGKKQPLTLLIMTNYAIILYHTNPTKAKERLEEIVAIREECGLLYHTDSIPVFDALIAIYNHFGEMKMYVIALRKQYDICLATLGEGHPKTQNVKTLVDKLKDYYN